jgi:outer membrane protein TolC
MADKVRPDNSNHPTLTVCRKGYEGDLKMSGRLKACVFLCALVFPAHFSLARTGNEAAVPEIWTVRAAVNYAIHNNPDSTIASHRLAAAQADIVREKATFYPQLDFSSRYSQTDNPMYSFGNILNQGAFSPDIDFNDPGRTDDLNTAVRLSYRLYNGGSDQAGVAAAEAGEEAARMTLEALNNQLAFSAVRSFNHIVQAEGMVKIHTAALSDIEALLAIARARYSEGVLLRADLLNLEVQQSASQENLLKARNRLAVARKIFLNLLGLPDGRVEIDPEPGASQDLPANTSYAQRYEIRIAQAMIRAAEFRLRQVQGGSHPVLAAFAGYDYDQGWEMDNNGDSWQAGVQLQYNLFDGHRKSAAAASATAGLAGARAQLRKTELALGLEVKQAELALEDAETRLLVTRKGVELAMESARITRARFKEGAVLSSDLLGVENRLTDAQLRGNLAETARRIAVADLRRAYGLPQFEETAENPESRNPALEKILLSRQR